jgi:hypothetical protein
MLLIWGTGRLLLGREERPIGYWRVVEESKNRIINPHITKDIYDKTITNKVGKT